MHGEYLLVAAVDSSRQAIIVAGQSFPFGKNDTLVFYGHDTQYKGTADIADLYSVKQPDSTAGKQTTSMGNPQGFQSYDDLDFLEVDARSMLSHPVSARLQHASASALAGRRLTSYWDMRSQVVHSSRSCVAGGAPPWAQGGCLAACAASALAVYTLWCSCS